MLTSRMVWRRPIGRRLTPAAAAVVLVLANAPFHIGPARADQSGDEQLVASRLNNLRASRGLPGLAIDARLTATARAWSGRMAATGVLAHDPDLATEVVDWLRLGQNVGTGSTAALVSDQFAVSPSHLANMTSPLFNSIGVGVVSVGDRVWVTEVFTQAPVAAARSAPADLGVPAPASAPAPVAAGTSWYRLAGAGGETYAFGASPALPPVSTSSPIVGAAAMAGRGGWLVSADGVVHTQGDAPSFGSLAGHRLAQPVIGMAATPTGRGYWLVARDGGIFAFGDARFLGSTGAMRLNQPIVAMASTPSGNGYWFVGADGGIFSFGDARFLGSTGAMRLNQAVVGMAPTIAGRGYWLVARDGGIFAFGDARFLGSTGAIRLNQPIVAMSRSTSGNGYRFVAADGGIFSFGDAAFLGSTGGRVLASPVTAMVAGA